MTIPEYTIRCQNITEDAIRTMPGFWQTRFVKDPQATPDKPQRKALKFCVWGSSGGQFWNRHYSSYSIVYDPYKELAENASFQIRFMFFLNRNETGKGDFNQAVADVLRPLDRTRGFELKTISKPGVIFLSRLYNNPLFGPQWQKMATEDLAWLIAQTFPQFDKLSLT